MHLQCHSGIEGKTRSIATCPKRRRRPFTSPPRGIAEDTDTAARPARQKWSASLS
jgi:hypothetical protein